MGTCCHGGVESALPSKDGPKVAETLSREEQIIVNCEKKLEFSKLASKEIIKSLKAEGIQNSLSLAQLKRVYHDLELPDDDLSSPESGIYRILSKLKNDKKLYDLRKLSLLGLLVGKGSSQEKADWLFKQYDLDASGMIDEREVETMLNEIIDLSVNIIPGIAKGEGAEFLSKEEIDSYKETLLTGQENTVQEVMKLLLNDKEISEAEFASKICDPSQKLNKLLWSYGVRSLVKSYASPN